MQDERIQLQENFDSIRIVVEGERHWLKLALLLGKFAIIVAFVIPVFVITTSSLLEKIGREAYIPWAIVLLALFFLIQVIMGAQRVIQYLTNQDVIEIDSQNVTIEKSILGVQDRREIPAAEILRITQYPTTPGTQIAAWPALIIVRKRRLFRYHTFGRGIAIADAQKMVDLIHKRFPQYNTETSSRRLAAGGFEQ